MSYSGHWHATVTSPGGGTGESQYSLSKPPDPPDSPRRNSRMPAGFTLGGELSVRLVTLRPSAYWTPKRRSSGGGHDRPASAYISGASAWRSAVRGSRATAARRIN